LVKGKNKQPMLATHEENGSFGKSPSMNDLLIGLPQKDGKQPTSENKNTFSDSFNQTPIDKNQNVQSPSEGENINENVFTGNRVSYFSIYFNSSKYWKIAFHDSA